MNTPLQVLLSKKTVLYLNKLNKKFEKNTNNSQFIIEIVLSEINRFLEPITGVDCLHGVKFKWNTYSQKAGQNEPYNYKYSNGDLNIDKFSAFKRLVDK